MVVPRIELMERKRIAPYFELGRAQVVSRAVSVLFEDGMHCRAGNAVAAPEAKAEREADNFEQVLDVVARKPIAPKLQSEAKKSHYFREPNCEWASTYFNFYRVLIMLSASFFLVFEGFLVSMAQAELNIGTVGHVDHGKTSLVQALTGKWTDTHSEEIKRGITIKLGYADATFYRCVKCPAPQCFSTKQECPSCNRKTERMRKISFVDAPGHETLMATVIAASSIIDGAIFVIAATEKCPMPQTLEHLAVLEAAGIKNVVVAQNKVDLVTKERAKEHYDEIRAFLKGTAYENVPVVPTVANHNLNLDALIQSMEATIKTPERAASSEPVMYIARSFDVNRPGTKISEIQGGVVGGSIIRGEFKQGDEVEILPGASRKKKEKTHYLPLKTKITSLHAGDEMLSTAKPGGLIAICLEIDPALSKADSLVGCAVGLPGKLPPLVSEMTVKIAPLERVMQSFPVGLGKDEPLVLGIGTNTTVGFVESRKKDKVTLTLKKPVSADRQTKIAVMRRAQNRWRLYGTATMV